MPITATVFAVLLLRKYRIYQR